MDVGYFIERLFLVAAVLGVIVLPMIYFSNRQDRQIAAGDVKAAASKAWFAVACTGLLAVLEVFSVIHHEGIWSHLRNLAMFVFCSYKSVGLWENVRRMNGLQRGDR